MNGLRKLRIKATEKVNTNYSQSLLVPELIDNTIRYRFFTYTSYIRENGIVEFYVEKMYECIENDYENIIEKKLENDIKIEIKNAKDISYDQSLDLMAEYYELIEKVVDTLYKKDLKEETSEDIKRLKEVFSMLEAEEIQEKVYKLICPNFINKINQI